MTWFVGLLCFCVGMLLVWVQAHHTIAEESKRLGAFFVNKEIFHVTKIEQYEEIK